jgi:predicted HNH restriction endonuclease
MANVAQVAAWRRRTKAKLVEAHGGKCYDCGLAFPPFMFDFDHRDPSVKLFAVSADGKSISYGRQYEESLKCDLVCANCHRMRTHRQRCEGCEHCKAPEIVSIP